MIYCSHCGAQMPDGARFCANCGKPMLPPPVLNNATNTPVPYDPNNVAVYNGTNVPMATVETVDTYPSRFTGGAFAYFFIQLLTILVSIISLTLLLPAMLCWEKRWECKHTYIHGRQLRFDGRGAQLFGRWLLWILLSIVTLTIYLFFFLPIAKEKWIVKHTHFADNGEPVEGSSTFDGGAGGLIGVRLAAFFVTLITLSFGLYWAVCYTNRWYKKHTIIDGCRLNFDGRGIQLFGKIVCWTLLTIITIGIFSFWYVVKVRKWKVSHTHTNDIPNLPPMPNSTVVPVGPQPNP